MDMDDSMGLTVGGEGWVEEGKWKKNWDNCNRVTKNKFKKYIYFH